MLAKNTFLALLSAVGSLAQNAAYSQCGGQGWTGSKTCVSGYTCQAQSQYYSQCLPSGQGERPIVAQTASSAYIIVGVTTKQTTAASPTSTQGSSNGGGGGGGVSYKASFTQYGAGDTFGSPNCNTNTAACFFYTQPGFSAAVSQNLYGAGPVRQQDDNHSERDLQLIVEHLGRWQGSSLRNLLETYYSNR